MKVWKADGSIVIGTTAQKISTKEVEWKTLDLTGRWTIATIDANRINPQRMLREARKRTTIVEGRKLVTARKRWGWLGNTTFASWKQLTIAHIFCRIFHSNPPERRRRISSNLRSAKRMLAIMKSHIFDTFDTISILGVLKHLNLAWVTSAVHEGAVVPSFLHGQLCACMHTT